MMRAVQSSVNSRRRAELPVLGMPALAYVAIACQRRSWYDGLPARPQASRCHLLSAGWSRGSVPFPKRLGVSVLRSDDPSRSWRSLVAVHDPARRVGRWCVATPLDVGRRFHRLARRTDDRQRARTGLQRRSARRGEHEHAVVFLLTIEDVLLPFRLEWIAGDRNVPDRRRIGRLHCRRFDVVDRRRPRPVARACRRTRDRCGPRSAGLQRARASKPV